jgi:hypothetical protein
MTPALTSRIARSRRHRYGGDGHRHHLPAAFRPSGSWRGSMNADGMPDYRRQPVNGGSSSVPTAAPTPRIIRHLAFALPLHVRQLRQSGLPVPAEVDEWAAFLSHSVGVRPELTVVDHDLGGPQHASAGPRPQQGHLVTRLLVTTARQEGHVSQPGTCGESSCLELPATVLPAAILPSRPTGWRRMRRGTDNGGCQRRTTCGAHDMVCPRLRGSVDDRIRQEPTWADS